MHGKVKILGQKAIRINIFDHTGLTIKLIKNQLLNICFQ